MHIEINRGEQECTLLVEFATGQTCTINIMDEDRTTGLFTGELVLPPVVMVSDRDGDHVVKFTR